MTNRLTNIRRVFRELKFSSLEMKLFHPSSITRFTTFYFKNIKVPVNHPIQIEIKGNE